MCLARMADINGVGPRPRRLASRSQITSRFPRPVHRAYITWRRCRFAAPWAPQCSVTRPLSVLYLPLHYWYGNMRLLGERSFCDSISVNLVVCRRITRRPAQQRAFCREPTEVCVVHDELALPARKPLGGAAAHRARRHRLPPTLCTQPRLLRPPRRVTTPSRGARSAVVCGRCWIGLGLRPEPLATATRPWRVSRSA